MLRSIYRKSFHVTPQVRCMATVTSKLPFQIDTDNMVKIKMTLTTPNCPVAESLPKEVKESVKEVKNVKDVELDLVWDPPWDKSMMSEAAKLELNL